MPLHSYGNNSGAGPAKRWHVNEPALGRASWTGFWCITKSNRRYPNMKGFLPYATLVGYETRR